MGKVGWIGMGTYLLVDLEGCPAAKFPSVEYICGGNGSKALQSFWPGVLSGVDPGGVCKGVNEW